jgi:5-methylcytosine-specific restriction endonuclease McrA
VLTAALELLIEKQEKRKASVPAKVKREVRVRDGGKCQWPVVGGGVCGSTVRLEVDHVMPRGRGGPSTVENCRILCKPHNLEAARQVYGDQHMELFTRSVPVAREAEAPA